MTTGRVDYAPDYKPSKYKLDMNDPEIRAAYERALAKWDRKLKPLTDAIRRAGRITGDDLNIRVGPCAD